MDIASLRAKLDNIAEELAQLPEQETVAIEEETIEEAHMMPKTLKCKECGDMLGNPTTDCQHDSQDPKGDNWIMIDVDNDGDMDMAMANEEAVEEGFAVGASVAPSEEGPDQAPGKVVAVDGDKVTVKFMDGSTEVFSQDELFALPDDLKVEGKKDDEEHELEKLMKGSPIDIDASGPMNSKKMKEEAVEEATVEVPVQELADLMQLAGYENYAHKIEEYANEPDEQYQDAEDQLIGLSGGLNGPKNMHTPAAGGDNPMDKEALKTVEESLYKSYKDFLEEAEIKKD